MFEKKHCRSLIDILDFSTEELQELLDTANDIIARLNGDKFGVISVGLNVDSYKKVLSSVSKECLSWKEQNSYPFEVDVSAGFAMFPSLKNGYKLEPLLEKAEESVLKNK